MWGRTWCCARESKRGRRVVVIFHARYPRTSGLEVTILGKVQTRFPFPVRVLGWTNRHRMPASQVLTQNRSPLTSVRFCQILSNRRGATAAMTTQGWPQPTTDVWFCTSFSPPPMDPQQVDPISYLCGGDFSLCVSRFSASGYLYAWLASLFNLILVQFVAHKQKYNMRTCVVLI
jgi:hypothetical protein